MRNSIILFGLLMTVNYSLVAMQGEVPRVSEKKVRVGQPPRFTSISADNHTPIDKQKRLSIGVYCYFSMRQSLQESPTSKR